MYTAILYIMTTNYNYQKTNIFSTIRSSAKRLIDTVIITIWLQQYHPQLSLCYRN